MIYRNNWVYPFLLIVIIIGVHSWSLMRYPAPFVDEAWTGSRSWAFIQTGRSFGPMDEGVFSHLDGNWTILPLLPSLFQSIGLRLVGAPSLFALRLVSLLFGFLLLLAIYWIGVCVRSGALGFIAVLMTAFSWPFIYSAHLARPDIMAAALCFLAVSLLLKKYPEINSGSKSTRLNIWIHHVLCGLLVGLAFEVHPHSVIFMPAIVTMLIFNPGWQVCRPTRFWGFMIGLAIGLLFYVCIHVLPYPQTFVEFNRLVFTATHTPPLLTLNPRIILTGLIDQFKLLIVVYQPLLILIVLGGIALIKRRSLDDYPLVMLGIFLFGGFWLLVRNKFFIYVILFAPVLDLWMASWLLDLMQQPWRSTPSKILRIVVVLGICFGMLLSNLSLLRINTYHTYLEDQARINQNVQDGETIIASQLYWFGLSENKYYSWEELIYFRRYFPGTTISDAFYEFQPDIFILDGHIAQYVSDLPGDTLFKEQLNLPKQELENFLAKNSRLIDSFKSNQYGQIFIYRLDW